MSQPRSASRGVHGMRMKVAGGLSPSAPVCTKVTNGAPAGWTSVAPSASPRASSPTWPSAVTSKPRSVT